MSEDRKVRVWVQRFADRDTLVLQWHDPETGKRKSKSAATSDPVEAERQRVIHEDKLARGEYRPDANLSWARFRELFENEYLPGKRPNTRRNYGSALDLFERLCSPVRLKSVNERVVSGFGASLYTVDVPGRGRGMKPSSIKVTLRLLRTALRWAAEQGLIKTSPAFPKVAVPKHTPRPVPVETFERLLGKAPDREMKVYLLTGWLAGLRLREAYFLEWEETRDAPYVDFGKGRVVIPAELAKSAEDQWVPLDPDLKRELEALPRTGRHVFGFVGRSGRRLTAGAVSKRVADLARAAGVRLTMKSLRRGFGCYHAARVPAQVLQRLMRHSDIRVTTTYYSNVDAAAEEAVRAGRRNTLRNTQPEMDGAGAQSRPAPCIAQPKKEGTFNAFG
jgi:integrase